MTDAVLDRYENKRVLILFDHWQLGEISGTLKKVSMNIATPPEDGDRTIVSLTENAELITKYMLLVDKEYQTKQLQRVYFNASSVTSIKSAPDGENSGQPPERTEPPELHFMTKEEQESQERVALTSLYQAEIDRWDEHINYCLLNFITIPLDWVTARNKTIAKIKEVNE